MERPKSDRPAGRKRLPIKVSRELRSTYSNAAIVSHTPTEFVIDFLELLPRSRNAQVVSRIIVAPLAAKMMRKALDENLTVYEGKFGEIQFPKQPSLADQLFRFGEEENPPEGDEENREGDGDST